ncbi:MAG TPA: glutathione S-transferase N-terminal domain-containing protein [Burkholderiales bacterium]|nr:glutathione S-transferase N-terminal domain-containing protein [Burkholderiales bacterium]
MKLELYFAPGACSFVPHATLESIKAATGQDFEPKIVKLHRNEQKSPEYLAINPNGQVPVLVVDGKPLNQIVAIIDLLDRAFPMAGVLPQDPWAHGVALSRLAWMNNTLHPIFTQIFRTPDFVEGDAHQAELKKHAMQRFRNLLGRLQDWAASDAPRGIAHDAYCFTLLRWGGLAGIDPSSLSSLKTYVEGVMRKPAIAAALERERVKLDTYKAG